jgi:hypothetical protein
MNPKFDRMRPKSSEPGRPVKRSKPMGKNLLSTVRGAILTSSAPTLWLPGDHRFSPNSAVLGLRNEASSLVLGHPCICDMSK